MYKEWSNKGSTHTVASISCIVTQIGTEASFDTFEISIFREEQTATSHYLSESSS